MAKLSIIVPFCNEWPQVSFTIQSLAQELIGRADFEIIAVDNYVENELKPLGYERDRSGEHIEAVSKGNEWLKFVRYTEKLSHWNAKRVGVMVSTGDILCFIDAHCIISRDALYNMFRLYEVSHRALHGTIHLPLTYHILEWHRLAYKLNVDIDKAKVEYQFTAAKDMSHPYEVPCMSTCGMMMTRELYDRIGGWPRELGIYGGGENFLNFTLSVLGYKKWVMHGSPLFHHGDKRGYCYNYTDMIRNKTIAAYLYGGENFARTYISNVRGKPEVLEYIHNDVITTCRQHRELIKSQQVCTIQEWLKKYENPS